MDDRAARRAELEQKIKDLEHDIRYYSSKAAEVMVEGTEDNSFKVETETRLEELSRRREELRVLLQPSPPQSTPPPSSQGPPPPPRQTPPASNNVVPLANILSRKDAAIQASEKRHRAYGIEDAVFLCSLSLEYSDLISCACVSKFWRGRIRKTPGWRRIVLNLESTLYGHIGKITSLTMYENYMVTGSTDGKIKFWDSSKNSSIKTLNITPSPVQKYVHPKLKELRESQFSRNPHDSSSSKDEDEYAEYPVAVTSLLTVDKCVLIGAQDGRFIAWMATAPDKKEFEYMIHSNAITSIVVGGAGGEDFVFTASLDGGVASIYRRGYPFVPSHYPNPSPTIVYGSKRHDQGVTSLAFAGGHLFSGDYSGKIYVWSPRSTLEFKQTLTNSRGASSNGQPMATEHTDKITSMAGIGDRLYTASWDGSIKLWNASNLELLRDVPVLPIGICWSLAIRRDVSSRANTLVAGVRDSDICIMDWETLEVLSSCETNHWAYKLDQHKHWVRTVMALGDGRIVTGSDDWTVKIWHIRGTPTVKAPPLFLGLPTGPLSEEDIDIILARMEKAGQRYSVQQLQEQKVQHDKTWEMKIASLSNDQLNEHNSQVAKATESWNRWRSERRKKDAGTTTTTTAANETPSATTESTVIPSTPATPAVTTSLATPMEVETNGEGSSNNNNTKSEESPNNEVASTFSSIEVKIEGENAPTLSTSESFSENDTTSHLLSNGTTTEYEQQDQQEQPQPQEEQEEEDEQEQQKSSTEEVVENGQPLPSSSPPLVQDSPLPMYSTPSLNLIQHENGDSSTIPDDDGEEAAADSDGSNSKREGGYLEGQVKRRKI